MTKRKRSKREISEHARRQAENSPVVRQLRELYDKGIAELEARRKPGDPPIERDLRKLYERGMAELREREQAQQPA
jgi:hypothetical protein